VAIARIIEELVEENKILEGGKQVAD